MQISESEPYVPVLSGDKHCKYLNALAKIAALSKPVANARLASALVYKRDIVSIGCNELRSHPFQARFGKNADSIFLHSEVNCICSALKLLSLDEIAKSSLYICRVKFCDTNKDKFMFGLAKPCAGCLRAIETFEIRNVIFSTERSYTIERSKLVKRY